MARDASFGIARRQATRKEDGTMDPPRTYLPAAGRDWALPLYDPFVALIGGTRTRDTLIAQAGLGAARRVLEIGCGTGTLVVRIKRRFPALEVVGLDPDPKALARAQRKADRAALAIRFERAFADQIPDGDASFDRIFSSLMFHHIPAPEKLPSLREALRVLTRGGSFHLVDLAAGGSRHGAAARALHSAEELRDNTEDRVLALMREAGFRDARKVDQDALVFGRVPIAYYRGIKD
jgi:SAM-dependent methyltransferase